MVLNVPARCYRVCADPDVPCVELNFGYVKRVLPIPLEEAALVLVDVWNTHYISSWLARATQVIYDKIVPLSGPHGGPGCRWSTPLRRRWPGSTPVVPRAGPDPCPAGGRGAGGAHGGAVAPSAVGAQGPALVLRWFRRELVPVVPGLRGLSHARTRVRHHPRPRRHCRRGIPRHRKSAVGGIREMEAKWAWSTTAEALIQAPAPLLP